MRITSTTLRRIIKEELEAVMYEADAFQAEKDEEDRAATAASAAAFQGSPERAMMAIEDHVEDMLRNELFMEWYLDDIDFRKLEAMSDDNPQRFMKLIAARLEELGPGRGMPEAVFDGFDLQAELNEEDENVARARKAKHIGPAFDVEQNKFQLDPEYQEKAKAMRKRVAKMKGKMNEDEDAEDAAEDAAYDNLESCVRTVIKDLLAAGVGADEASNIVFAAVRSTVYRAL
jgi:hypothetical protein